MTATVYSLTGQFELSFLYRNAIIISGVRQTIGTAFETNPMPGIVNGALWTLPWELRAYCLVAGLGVLGLLNKRRIILIIAMGWYVVFITQILSYPGRVTSPAITSSARLLCFFFMGVLFYNYRNLIPMKRAHAIWASAILVFSLVVGVFTVNFSGGLFYLVAPIPLSYLVFYVSSMCTFAKINSSSDISYGVYIYGTFILACLSHLGLNKSWAVYCSLTMVLTLLLAWLSWIVVERKALILKTALNDFLFLKFGDLGK